MKLSHTSPLSFSHLINIKVRKKVSTSQQPPTLYYDNKTHFTSEPYLMDESENIPQPVRRGSQRRPAQNNVSSNASGRKSLFFFLSLLFSFLLNMLHFFSFLSIFPSFFYFASFLSYFIEKQVDFVCIFFCSVCLSFIRKPDRHRILVSFTYYVSQRAEKGLIFVTIHIKKFFRTNFVIVGRGG